MHGATKLTSIPFSDVARYVEREGCHYFFPQSRCGTQTLCVCCRVLRRSICLKAIADPLLREQAPPGSTEDYSAFISSYLLNTCIGLGLYGQATVLFPTPQTSEM